MIFRQLFDRSSCTYTYLLACSKTGEAVLIDPVREHVARDSALIEELGLRLVWTLETHVHADHVTSSGLLRDALATRSVVSASGGAPCADRLVHHGELVRFGDEELEVRATPGHTHGCVAYVHHGEGMVFTGDTLLIRGCGRTDFQQGDARQLYQSVYAQLFSLPDNVFIYPGHDYLGRTRSTVAEEKAHNPRLGGGRSVEAFVEIMANLKLPSPAQIDVAVPANQQCGWLAGDPPRSAQGGPWAPISVQDGVPEVHIDWVRAHGPQAARVHPGRVHHPVHRQEAPGLHLAEAPGLRQSATNPTLEEYITQAGERRVETTGVDPAAVDKAWIGNFVGELFSNQGHLGAAVIGAHPGLLHKPSCASRAPARRAASRSPARSTPSRAAPTSRSVVGAEVQTTASARQGGDYLARASHYAASAASTTSPSRRCSPAASRPTARPGAYERRRLWPTSR
jgi:sulfur dioxygenase